MEATIDEKIHDLLRKYPRIEELYGERRCASTLSDEIATTEYEYKQAFIDGSVTSERSHKSINALTVGDVFIIDRDARRIPVECEEDQSIEALRKLYYLGYRREGLEGNKKCFIRVNKINEEDEILHCEVIGFACNGIKFTINMKSDRFIEKVSGAWSVPLLQENSRTLEEVRFIFELIDLYNNNKEGLNNMMDKIYNIANEIYPGMVDMVSKDDLREHSILHGSFRHGAVRCLIIKFPEVIIRNRKDESHKIRDLYVIIPIRLNGGVGGVQGTRGTLEAKEVKANYMHSHLPRRTVGIGFFCLGSGSFSTNYSTLSAGFDEELWEVMLTQLRYYVAWESLSGGPYNYIYRAISGGVKTKSYLNKRTIKRIVKTLRGLLPRDMKKNLPRLTIHSSGNGFTQIEIEGWGEIGEFIRDYEYSDKDEFYCDLDDFKKAYTQVTMDNQEIGDLTLREARNAVEAYKRRDSYQDFWAEDRGFRFQGELVRQQVIIDEELYKESYDTGIIDLNAQLKSYLESYIAMNFMNQVTEEVNKSEKKNNRHNEYKQQIENFPEEILTSTPVF